MLILSRETEALAQRIALAKPVGVDEAIRAALEETARAEGIAIGPRPLRDSSPEARAARIARFEEIGQASALPVLVARPTKEIIDELNDP